MQGATDGACQLTRVPAAASAPRVIATVDIGSFTNSQSPDGAP